MPSRPHGGEGFLCPAVESSRTATRTLKNKNKAWGKIVKLTFNTNRTRMVVNLRRALLWTEIPPWCFANEREFSDSVPRYAIVPRTLARRMAWASPTNTSASCRGCCSVAGRRRSSDRIRVLTYAQTCNTAKFINLI